MKRRFEQTQLILREAESFEQWWRAVCTAADQMRCVRVTMPLRTRDGTLRTLRWRREDIRSDRNRMVQLTFPVHDRRAGPPLSMKVETPINGSVDAAGRLLTYFGRLLDKRSIADLTV